MQKLPAFSKCTNRSILALLQEDNLVVERGQEKLYKKFKKKLQKKLLLDMSQIQYLQSYLGR